ncbi:Hypothetical protein BN2458_PEG1316 [Helicobacter typhlonius]|uniref:Uncharacterized protein n=1 Tax=Helicobacter typhlonius TaxID=76936 RepID=A0A0S4PVA0_9HELI|nr:Hypothetical protein BN2458_PEG1316 [Helicobacter typhlonius]
MQLFLAPRAYVEYTNVLSAIISLFVMFFKLPYLNIQIYTHFQA